MTKLLEIIAHRGAGEGHVQPEAPPENTLLAVERAWREGTSAEIDVRLTREGKVVAIHDADTTRTTNASLRVARHTLDELHELDAGSWKGGQWASERIPTLEEILETVPAAHRLHIEVKSGPRIVHALAEQLRETDVEPAQLPLLSFNVDTLSAIRRALSDHPCTFLLNFEWDERASQWNASHTVAAGDSTESHEVWSRPAELNELLKKASAIGITDIGVSAKHPDELPQMIADAGMTWAVWTVDDVETAAAMAARGAHAITSNRAGLIRQGLIERGIAIAG